MASHIQHKGCSVPNSVEDIRLERANAGEEDWRRWGTYLPERQWGTVREDYSENGNAWAGFTYEMARYRAYRWGEDGLLGWTDRQCRLCFSTSLWNGEDDSLKERLFGLTNPEGNHGEDVKELFYYLDATPTHSYAKALYKYPHAAFPYDQLREENKKRGHGDREYELLDTGVFDADRYFDVQIEYAKRSPEDTLIRLSIANRGPEMAGLDVLPTLTLRNSWSWKNLEDSGKTRPSMHRESSHKVRASHATLGNYLFQVLGAEPSSLIFTENDSNLSELDPSHSHELAFSKDAFDRFIVHGEWNALRTDGHGTKCAFVFRERIAAGESIVLRLRLVRENLAQHTAAALTLQDFEETFDARIREANEFYEARLPPEVGPEERVVARQAYAGLLWCKQFYYFVADIWQCGDPTQVPPPEQRGKQEQNWTHLFCRDVLSMPDKWEYPWFAAWDMAFHMIPMAEIDPEYAKASLLLLLREWYLHPNGQMPAYEFAFSDVNPPVHAWAVWHVYRMGVNEQGEGDLSFLERTFQKLLINFTWWVNRVDANGRNLFRGGFLGMDNIGVFDRSKGLPSGSALQQADGTAWMGLYCACMLQMALELAHRRSAAYEDIASKFFEHYIAIIDALNRFDGAGLWDEEEGFYFDRLKLEGTPSIPLKVKSMVGLIPLLSVCILKRDTCANLHGFQKRFRWLMEHKPELTKYVQCAETEDDEINGSYWISIVPSGRFERVLSRLFDATEFLSPHGIRALSKEHAERPFQLDVNDKQYLVRYTPAEGDNDLFGGNSNWRGPVWFPVNTMLVSALERYYLVLGSKYKRPYPTTGAQELNLLEIAKQLSWRLISIFLPDAVGERPCHGGERRYAQDPHWRDLLLFNEYFSGDDGRGVGATHQTGWTAMVATLIRRFHMDEEARRRAQ